jgi:hypothetical protein
VLGAEARLVKPNRRQGVGRVNVNVVEGVDQQAQSVAPTHRLFQRRGNLLLDGDYLAGDDRSAQRSAAERFAGHGLSERSPRSCMRRLLSLATIGGNQHGEGAAVVAIELLWVEGE